MSRRGDEGGTRVSLIRRTADVLPPSRPTPFPHRIPRWALRSCPNPASVYQTGVHLPSCGGGRPCMQGFSGTPGWTSSFTRPIGPANALTPAVVKEPGGSGLDRRMGGNLRQNQIERRSRHRRTPLRSPPALAPQFPCRDGTRPPAPERPRTDRNRGPMKTPVRRPIGRLLWGAGPVPRSRVRN